MRPRGPLPAGVAATGGTWDRGDWPTYFIASHHQTIEHGALFHDHVLVAVNELDDESGMRGLRQMVANGRRVFVDSGVFNLSTSHAKAHGLSMDQALSMAPDEVDGFADLFGRYVAIVHEMGDRLWGYIEIDQGGRENKLRTRARLEAMGLRPIPVYHPFNDGWDYFDFLAQRYDRICFGNVVQADPHTRKRLVATAWERRRHYPHLWLHMLGLTPSELTAAYPPDSCDSSTWLAGIRWGLHDAIVANKRVWSTGKGLCYEPRSDAKGPSGSLRATGMAAYEAHVMRRQVMGWANDLEASVGADIGLFDQQDPA